MAPEKAKREDKPTAQEAAGKEQAEKDNTQAPDAGEGSTYQVSLNPERSSIEVVVYLDGERRAFKGGEVVTQEERDELAKVKVRTRDGKRVQALNFREVSA